MGVTPGLTPGVTPSPSTCRASGKKGGSLDAGDLVGPEIVGNDDVAGLQGRHQDLFDVGAEALAIDRAVEDPRCGQPRDPQRGEKRAGLPAPAGGVVVDARAARCPAAAEAIPGAIGLSGSTVSRAFIQASAAKLRELQERDLSGEDVVALVLDGKTFAEATMVVALGITMTGGTNGSWALSRRTPRTSRC